MKVVIYTDGACRGNPGPASVGIVVTNVDGDVIHEISKTIGSNTNNYAEYMAVIEGLKYCAIHGAKEVIVRADSQLLVRQMTGEYRVKAENIIPLNREVKKLVEKFKTVGFEHIRRELNEAADRLANLALDGGINS